MARTDNQESWQFPANQGGQHTPGAVQVIMGTATISSGDTTVDVGTPFGGSKVKFANATPVTVTAATLLAIGTVGTDRTLTSNALTFSIGATLGSDLDINYLIVGKQDDPDA